MPKMPPPKSSGKTSLMIGSLGFGMLLVLSVGMYLYKLSVEMLDAGYAVVETQGIISSLSDFRATIKDLETEERGFIITGDQIYLQPYYEQRKSLPAAITRIASATKSQKTMQPLLNTLSNKVLLRVDDLNRAINLRQQFGFQAAADMIASNRGLHTMNELKATIAEMLIIETRMLHDFHEQLISRTKMFFVIFVLLALSCVALFLGVAYFIRRHLHEIECAHLKLLKHNTRLSEFYSILAHELRTPMTSIRGALGLIKGRASANMTDSSKRLVEIASDETERMLRLINELLDLEKIDSGTAELKLTVAEPAKILRRTLQGMQGMAAEAKVQLVDEVNATKPIKCDEDRITQVLTNLISNAIKFSHPNDQVTVSIDINPNDEVKFSVKDVGPGIPAHQQHKVFQKFQQIEETKSTFKGTGLGLAISKSITEVHGGKIGFESEVGRGTTFWIALPQCNEEIARAA